MKLCVACTECIEDRRERFEADIFGCLHHARPADFMKAVEHGCYCCSQLLNQVSTRQRTELLTKGGEWDVADSTMPEFTRALSPRSEVIQPHGRFWFRIEFGRYYNNEPKKLWWEELLRNPGLSVWLELVPVTSEMIPLSAAPLSGKTDSEETWLQISRWCDGCVNNHIACNALREPMGLPTRLLDVGAVNDASPDYITLVLGRDIDTSSRYATLSHCWGDLKMFTLTKANLGDCLTRGIALANLTQTFKDAVHAARKINIHYLWIDSLCIIQDPEDMSDWLAESTRMESYYGNAYINIAATASRDGSEGLFRVRNPNLLDPGAYVMSSHAIRPAIAYQAYDSEKWRSSLGFAVLNRRAWVLQERLLARRVVHFSTDQVIWECCELTASETEPSGSRYGEQFKDIDPRSNKHMSEFPDKTDKQRVTRIWKRIAKAYSQCKATYPADKVVAFAGIGSYFESLMGDILLYGMWKERLAKDLFWKIGPGTSNTSPQDPRYWSLAPHNEYPVPTWSWLSPTLPVELDTNYKFKDTESAYFKTLIEVKAIRSSTLSDGHIRPLANGKLLLECALKTACVELRDYSYWFGRNGRFFNNDNAVGYDFALVDEFPPKIAQEGNRLQVFYFPGRGVPVKDSSCYSHIECLVLLPVLGAIRGTYQRIGVFRENDYSKVLLFMAEQADEADVPCVSYDYETHRHQIYLV